jgi:hypothetical protein
MREGLAHTISSAITWCFGSTRVTDDSRRALFFSTPDDGLEQLPASYRFALSGWFWVGPLIGAFVVVGLVAVMLELVPGSGGAGMVGMIGVVAAIVTLRRRRRVALPQLIRLRLSHGRCGACGYPLRDQAFDEHGCRTCPECAGVWARRPEVSRPYDSPYSLSLPRQRFARGNDDRKKPVRVEMTTLAATGQLSGPGLAVFRAAEREGNNQLWSSILLLLGIAVCCALVAAFAQLFNFATLRLERLLTSIGISALTGALLVSIMRYGMQQRETDALTCGLCPACGTSLDASHPEPDGCVVCTHCSCAWKAEDIGSNPIPPDPCPKCGTERAGAARCVACNDRGFGTAGVGEPSPHCARCDTILPGHDRVCPRCGVANGTVYR